MISQHCVKVNIRPVSLYHPHYTLFFPTVLCPLWNIFVQKLLIFNQKYILKFHIAFKDFFSAKRYNKKNIYIKQCYISAQQEPTTLCQNTLSKSLLLPLSLLL